MPLWQVPSEHKVKILSAYIGGKWTYNATNYATFTLKDEAGNSIAAAALTTTSCAGTGFVSMGAITAAQAELAASEPMYLTVAHTAEGMPMTDVRIWWEYEFIS